MFKFFMPSKGDIFFASILYTKEFGSLNCLKRKQKNTCVYYYISSSCGLVSVLVAKVLTRCIPRPNLSASKIAM